MPSFEITDEEPRPGVFCVAVTGELDLATAYRFDRHLHDIEERNPTIICVDLRDLTMLDSAGLGRLIAAHRRARRGGWRFVVVRGGKAVSRILRMTRIDEHLELVRSPDAVLAPPT